MKSTAVLVVLAASQLVVQVVFQLTVLAGVGVGVVSDVFIAAQAVPAVMTAVLAGALQAVWQPLLAVAHGQRALWSELQRSAHAQALLACGGVAAVLALTAPAWAPALYAGLPPEARQTVVELTPWLLLAAVLQGATAVLTVAERGRDHLVLPEALSLGAALLALVAAVPAVAAWGVPGAAGVIVGRSLLTWSALVWAVGGSSPAWRAGWTRREAWTGLRPLVTSGAVYKSAPLVDRYWSAAAPVGSVTLLALAQMGMGAVASVVERAWCMPASPRIARCLAAGDVRGARAEYRRAVLAVGVVTAVLVGLLLAVRPVWSSMLGIVATIDARAAETLWMLCVLLGGFVFVAAAGTAVVAVYFAMGDTRMPARIGLAGFAVGVVAKSLGFLAAGLEGLVLATSLYYLLNLAALVWGVERRLTSWVPVPVPGSGGQVR